MIEQVGGSLGHPATAATRTERAAFARKRDEAVEAAITTPKSREPVGEPATLQKVPEFLHAKGLEVIAHDLVERGLRGTPRFVGRRGRGHSRPESGRRASDRSGESGRNRWREYSEIAISARLPPAPIAVPADTHPRSVQAISVRPVAQALPRGARGSRRRFPRVAHRDRDAP